jgi:hypothetical protein
MFSEECGGWTVERWGDVITSTTLTARRFAAHVTMLILDCLALRIRLVSALVWA